MTNISHTRKWNPYSRKSDAAGIKSFCAYYLLNVRCWCTLMTYLFTPSAYQKLGRNFTFTWHSCVHDWVINLLNRACLCRRVRCFSHIASVCPQKLQRNIKRSVHLGSHKNFLQLVEMRRYYFEVVMLVCKMSAAFSVFFFYFFFLHTP